VNRIFGLIGWIGTACVFVAFGIWFAGRTSYALPASWDPYRLYLAWAGLICLLIYVLSQWRDVVGLFSRRQARYGGLSFASILVVLGILIAINYIGQRQNRRWDLTASRVFSLSEQTIKVLSSLDSPLQVTVFAQDPQMGEFRDRLAEYQYISKQVAAEYVDPDKQRTRAQELNVQQYGTIVIQYKGRTERTTMNTEQDITNTIIKLVSGQQLKVYFTQGHGEKSTTASDRDGYSGVTDALKGENYVIEPLPLAQTGTVPDDASVVVVAGPRTDFLPQEVEALKTYLGRAGKLLLMIDPPEKADVAFPNLIALAHEWGVEVQNNIIVDVSGVGRLIGTDASVPVAVTYPEHQITSRFNVMTAYPLARGVVPIASGVNGHYGASFVETSPRSWAESDIRGVLAGQEVGMDEAQGDRPGPISLAVASTGSILNSESPGEQSGEEVPKEARVVVFGDSDFATNGVLGIQGNRDLFMNAVGWVSQQDNLIAIRPKEFDDRRLNLTAAQESNIMWLSLLVIPGAVFSTGIYRWWQRR
jgi:ABC-type uncharacterized transport system involved in gliding motility auxiliary subunit